MEILACAVGRRKEAVAQVQIVKGSGQFLINNIPASTYLHNNNFSLISIQSPYSVLSTELSKQTTLEGITVDSSIIDLASKDKSAKLTLLELDTIVKVKGGGLIGQAEAIKLGVARAICTLFNNIKNQKVNSSDVEQSQNQLMLEKSLHRDLKTKGLLTQDSRVKERRKYGLRKARKASQYHKR
uniref:ribosomal protein S9 n=1 Tax=Leontynka pallida TaxID=2912034 RepID=UPI002027EE60|nr:ribosomal protein S9 [Leontynka pallida]UPQ43868.1 ribosomal protein S9 [Leontynka pallida]